MKHFFLACFLIMFCGAVGFYIEGVTGLAAFILLAIIAFIKILEYMNGGD